MDEAQESHGQLVVTSRHAATVLDSVDEAFDYVAELIPLAIVPADAMSAARWNHGLGTDGANLVAQWVTIVSLIADHVPRFEVFQQDLGAGYVMPLPFRQMQLGRLAPAVDRDVDLSAETAAGTSKSLGVLPPFAPAACWWARTIVESSRRSDKSVSPPSASSTRPQTPRLHQRLNRL